jgi:amidohydrolase
VVVDGGGGAVVVVGALVVVAASPDPHDARRAAIVRSTAIRCMDRMVRPGAYARAMDLLEHARSIHADTVALRRDLHRRPEVGNHLPLTRERVLRALDGLGLDLHLHETTSGVVAVLDPGADGPGIVLRGDMDALPMPEDTGLGFASEHAGVMHACGHDLHTAMLASAARVLSERRDELGGPVVFMFQPGEEGYHGARYMLEEGLLEAIDPAPTGAFAIHVSSWFASGTISHRPGPQMASADTIHVTVHGRGGHASAPFNAADPIPAAAEIVLATETALTRSLNPFDPAVVTFAKIVGGTTDNVIPADVEMMGTMRTFSAENRERVQDLIRRVATNVAAAHGIEAEVVFDAGYPVTVNDEGFTAWVDGVTADILGAEVLTPLEAPIMGAEDWSYVLERVPGTMTFLGACPPDLVPGEAPGNHSNLVTFDEDAMAAGVALYAGVALAHTNGR